MTGKRKTLLLKASLEAVLILAAGVALGTGSAWAATPLYRFNTDGATCASPPCSGHSGGAGSWILPNHAVCQGIGDPSTPSRPECIASRVPAAVSAQCTNGAGSFSTTICMADTAHNASQAACEADNTDPNAPVRVWNPGVCVVSYTGTGDQSALWARVNGT